MLSAVVSQIADKTPRVTWALIVAGLLMAAVPGLCADEWPGQMTVGGFTINNIRPDSTTSAKGMLQIPGAGGKEISLTRSSRGDVTGSGSISGRVAGIDIQGDFKLDGNGLKCRGGVLKTNPRPITDADITIGNRGDMSGKGRFELASSRVNTDFSASNGSLRLGGSTPAKASADTQLAKYSFDGRLDLQGASGGGVAVVAQGKVERRGKLADQVTSYNVSNIQVNPSNGSGAVNIDGVGVTLDFF